MHRNGCSNVYMRWDSLLCLLMLFLLPGCMTMILAPVALVSAPFQAGSMLANGRPGYYGITEAEWLDSGDALVFAYRETRSSTQNLYILHLEEGTIQPITAGDDFNWGIHSAPGGGAIVFAKRDRVHADRSQRLYLWKRGETTPRRLTSLQHEEGLPQWSPNAQSIVFVSGNSVHVSSIDAMDAQRLSSNGAKEFFPSFVGQTGMVLYWTSSWYGHSSPIASSTYHDFTPSLVDIETGKTRDFGAPSFYTLYRSVVSRDGTRIFLRQSSSEADYASLKPEILQQAFDSESADATFPIEAMSHVPAMTFGRFTDNDDEILFGREDGSSAEVWLRSMSDMSEKQLTQFSKWIVDAALSPDFSKLIAIVSHDRYERVNHLELWIFDMESGELDTFTNEWVDDQLAKRM